MGSTAVVRIEDSERVRLVTLDRPDVLNAFNDALYDGVRDALLGAADRPDIAVVVVTGAGRAFSAGQDLGPDAAAVPDGSPHGFGPFMDAVDSFPKPLIAAVNGLGVGIGLTFLLHCDLVFMADDARLRAPFVSLGLTGEASSTYLLPLRVGWQQASRLLYTNAWIGAGEAEAMGLVTRVCPAQSLLDEALTAAREIAAMPVPSLVETKRLLVASHHERVRQARERENEAFGRLQGGPANREAVHAFREKRPPDFTKLG